MIEEAQVHWDFLLEEMQWLAKDMERERKWKIKQSKRFAFSVVRGRHDLDSKVERQAREEEARQKRNRSAAVGNHTPRSEQSAGGARERADSEPRPAGGARAAVASDAGDHVQAMLEAHSESDNDDSEGADMPWQNPYGPADHGPAPASSMPQGRNRRGSAPPARQDSERRGGAKEAPRCGPRGSVRGRAL